MFPIWSACTSAWPFVCNHLASVILALKETLSSVALNFSLAFLPNNKKGDQKAFSDSPVKSQQQLPNLLK